MIRQATSADLDQIADAYEEHFAFEETHPTQAFTVFKRGVYQTRRATLKMQRGKLAAQHCGWTPAVRTSLPCISTKNWDTRSLPAAP